jgi:hypothetical protein
VKWVDTSGDFAVLAAIGVVLIGFEVGCTVYDAVTAMRDTFSTQTSMSQKVASIGFLAAGVVVPGSGRVDAKIGERVVGHDRISNFTSRFGKEMGEKMNRVAEALSESGYKFTDHSIERMVQRIGVGNERKVLDVLDKVKPFQYIHENKIKNGYYDAVSKIFVGQANDDKSIITIITNVTEKYISNLLK